MMKPSTFLTFTDKGRIHLYLMLMALVIFPAASMQAQNRNLSIASNTSNVKPAGVTSSQADDEQHAVLLLDDICDQDRLINMSDPDQKYWIAEGPCLAFFVQDTR